MGLFDAFSNQPAQAAALAQQNGLAAGYKLASGLYDAGNSAINTGYGTAADAYKGLAATTQPGSVAYGDATGANGAQGLANASALFTQTPGYQQGINMSLDQNDRRAAARGMLGSGNTAADTTKLATDYASQKYGQYVQGLAPYLGANANAVGGQAATATGQAGALNANDLSQGQLQYGTQAGMGAAAANADMARYQTSANTLGAALKIAGLGSNTLGGQAANGIGNAASSLGSSLMGLFA